MHNSECFPLSLACKSHSYLAPYIFLAFQFILILPSFWAFFLTVIRAKISGEKIVSPSNSSSPYMKMIQYEIKMIKVRSLDSSYSCCWCRHTLSLYAAV